MGYGSARLSRTMVTTGGKNITGGQHWHSHKEEKIRKKLRKTYYNAQILIIWHLLDVPSRSMTNYMDRAKETTNRAILKGRLSGQPFCVHLLQALAA